MILNFQGKIFNYLITLFRPSNEEIFKRIKVIVEGENMKIDKESVY